MRIPGPMAWIVSVASLTVAAGCQGETYVLGVRLADGELGGLGCGEPRGGIKAIHVQVFRWGGWDDQSELGSECILARDEPAVADVESPEGLLSFFEERGYVARGIPTDASSIVRVQGFPLARCPDDEVEPIFCAMPMLRITEGVPEPMVLTEELTSGDEPITFSVICHPEMQPEAPAVCPDSVSIRCPDNVCGINESSTDCEADCGTMPDLCRFYRACAYFRRP